LASDSIKNDLALDCLAEQCRDVELWPRDPAARAIARSVSAEMHSGFQALRENCPMELPAHYPQSTLPPAVALDIHRIITIWRDCRTRFGSGGPFLFGQFSTANAKARTNPSDLMI
jgi:glutathione S-transferase